MVKILEPKEISTLQGIYCEPSCYNITPKRLKEVEVFDKNFPNKIKEKRKGQLE
jgi:hypothetical protein